MAFPVPNFRCRVAEEDRPQKKFSRLVCAPSEEAATKLLKDRHYIVHRVEAYDFAKWKEATKWLKKRAERARGPKDPKKRKTFDFKAAWSPLKEVLIDYFHGKCAYCDAFFAHVAWGDVEHFRPKAEVTGEPEHPGYYWLAYEPDNYLPACQPCNGGNAKKNRFPISGKRANGPTDDLAAEKPDLLHPLDDDFGKHLRFHPSTEGVEKAGRVEPLDQDDVRAKASIDAYRLNRGWLIEIRLREQKNALLAYRQAYANYIENDVKETLKEFLARYESKHEPFAAAVLWEVRQFAAAHNLPVSPFSRNGSRPGTT